MTAPAASPSDFPILATEVNGRPLVYLDNAATTQKPASVIRRTVEFYETENSNAHRGVHALSEKATRALEAGRNRVKAFIGAKHAHEVIFTGGTTDAINMVAFSFGEACVGRDDEILVTGIEHHSNYIPWQQLCRRTGAGLKVVPITDAGVLDLDAYARLLSGRTRIVAVTAVSNLLGTVSPLDRIIALAHGRGIPVLVDAAQAVPHFPVDVSRLDCDFLAFSGHKLYAETGIGVLYGKEQWLERLPPHRTGGGMVGRLGTEGAVWAELPWKFEAGTPNTAGVVSLHAAIDYIRDVGMDRIQEAEKELYRHALSVLSGIEGLTLYGSTPDNCGSISFNLDGLHHSDVGVILDKMGIAVRTGNHCAEPALKHFGLTGTIRASLAMYNTPSEIDLLADGLRKARALLSV